MATNTKEVKIGDILTPEEIDLALSVYQHAAPGTATQLLVKHVFHQSKMAQIDRITGQKNHAEYFAYLLQAVFVSRNLKGP